MGGCGSVGGGLGSFGCGLKGGKGERGRSGREDWAFGFVRSRSEVH